MGYVADHLIIYRYSPMFSRLKEAITKTGEEDVEAQKKRNIDVSFINPKEIEAYKKTLSEVKINVEQIAQISKNSKDDVIAFIKTQREAKETAKKPTQQEDEEYTLEEDMDQIKALIKDVILHLNKLQQTNEEIKDKVKNVGGEVLSEKLKESQDVIKKYETQIKSLRGSEENNKQILGTLRQQTQLLSKQTKDLQDKITKSEKELAEKAGLIQHLQEEKNILLEMRSIQSNHANPEIQNLKAQMAEIDKKLAIERTKVGQKEKEVETLKKKMEEDRDSLQKIADELKEKELKSKKILDKYERSKTEIRKFRQEKTEFIKKLNMEIASLTQKLQKTTAQNQDLNQRLRTMHEKNEKFQSEISKTEGKSMQLESARAQLKQLRQQQIQTSAKFEQQVSQNGKLKSLVDQLQLKRKSLLQALEKPINHEIRTLDKIIRALQRLYKEYIEIVFEKGNIIGFETKISYILSNVCEIKQDLKL